MKWSIKIGAVISSVLLATFFAGCQTDYMEPQGERREVSSDFVGIGLEGLYVNKGEMKESNADFVDGPVEFQDPVMEEMLRTMLKKTEGQVLRSDLQAIHAIYSRSGQYYSNLQSEDGNLPKDGTKWYASGQPKTLEDLALCDNLQWLEFGAIELPSLEPLAGLSLLETLAFYQTAVSAERLAELAFLPALHHLEVDFRNLNELNISSTGTNQTEDGSFLLPLADRLTHLQVLSKLTWSTEVMSQLTNLTCLLITSPEDICFLKAMPKLEKLYISGANLSDWRALGSATQLKYLSLCKCKGIRLEDVRPLSDLEYLDLTMTKFTPSVKRQEIIDALPGLTGLYM